MIQIKHPIPFPVGYDLTRIGPPETLLFFDIETTGFSADTALVYLIGCVWYQEGSWNLAQWFADSKEAEKEILAAFFSWAGKFSTLVHFNGDTFGEALCPPEASLFAERLEQRGYLPENPSSEKASGPLQPEAEGSGSVFGR